MYLLIVQLYFTHTFGSSAQNQVTVYLLGVNLEINFVSRCEGCIYVLCFISMSLLHDVKRFRVFLDKALYKYVLSLLSFTHLLLDNH